jgi:hypothetical protein
MKRTPALVIFAVAAAAACSGANPAEVRSDASAFPVVASWTASSAPVAPATLAGDVCIKPRVGFD